MRRDGPAGSASPTRTSPPSRPCSLLSGDPGATAADGRHALALPQAISETCTHRQHHRVLVFAGAGLQIPAGGLPWPGPSYVNLVLGAHHPDAVRDQVLLVGENEPDGTVLGDKGRISVVRLRPGSQRRPQPKNSGPAAVSEVAVKKGQRTVVSSYRLDDLGEGEQLVDQREPEDERRPSSATPPGSRPACSWPTIPLRTSPGGEAETVAAFRGVITASNGFNCLPKQTLTARPARPASPICARPRPGPFTSTWSRSAPTPSGAPGAATRWRSLPAAGSRSCAIRRRKGVPRGTPAGSNPDSLPSSA